MSFNRVVLAALAAFGLHVYLFSHDGDAATTATTMPVSPRSKHWIDTKAKICPQMAPNHRVWAKIFELAKVQLGVSENDIPAKEEDKEAISLFFRFNAGGFGYKSGSSDHLIYLRMHKCGSVQIMNNMYPPWGKFSRRKFKDPSWWMFNPISGLFGDTAKSSSISANNTCIITALRDPVEHFLSGYNEAMVRFWRGSGTGDGFRRFVRDFVTGPISTGVYVGRHKALAITHLYSLSGALRGLKRLKDCHGMERTPRFSAYLPSLKNLNNEFPLMVKEHCPQISGFDSSWQHEYVHQSQSDPYNYHSSAKGVWKEGGNTSRALCIMHILDYACFIELPIPDLCMGVYADEEFRKELLQAAEGENRDFEDEDSCGRDFPVI